MCLSADNHVSPLQPCDWHDRCNVSGPRYSIQYAPLCLRLTSSVGQQPRKPTKGLRWACLLVCFGVPCAGAPSVSLMRWQAIYLLFGLRTRPSYSFTRPVGTTAYERMMVAGRKDGGHGKISYGPPRNEDEQDLPCREDLPAMCMAQRRRHQKGQDVTTSPTRTPSKDTRRRLSLWAVA